MTLAHWDDAPSRHHSRAGLQGRWTDLGTAAGTVGVGLHRIQLAAGEVSTPAHVHGADEEIFFVLAGSGLSWQDGVTCEVRAGDCVVHRPLAEAHTLRGGDDGLDVLAFGHRTPVGGAYLPRLGARWMRPSWAEVGHGENPFDREPGLHWPDPGERPANVVHLDEVEGQFGGISKRLGSAAGSRTTGLNRVALPPEEEGAPPHCHSVEEEIFVILEGDGVLELWTRPDPERPRQSEPEETHPIRAGHVISRPPATRVPHSLRSGPNGMTYLAYGTREPSDACWYPRSNKVFWRGLGVIARVELLDYHDGEPS